jgi:hypothetical protein
MAHLCINFVQFCLVVYSFYNSCSESGLGVMVSKIVIRLEFVLC